MQQEVVLALLAKEPSHGYELRTRLRQALGPVGDAMNAGQIYVTLTRLEKAGLVTSEPSAGGADRPDRKVHALTPAGCGSSGAADAARPAARRRRGGCPATRRCTAAAARRPSTPCEALSG